MNIKNNITSLFIIFSTIAFSQENSNINAEKEFFVKVVVQDKDTRNAIKNATIFVNGKQFRYSEITSNYKVKAKVND
jgi:hypothetical protein